MCHLIFFFTYLFSFGKKEMDVTLDVYFEDDEEGSDGPPVELFVDGQPLDLGFNFVNDDGPDVEGGEGGALPPESTKVLDEVESDLKQQIQDWHEAASKPTKGRTIRTAVTTTIVTFTFFFLEALLHYNIGRNGQISLNSFPGPNELGSIVGTVALFAALSGIVSSLLHMKIPHTAENAKYPELDKEKLKRHFHLLHRRNKKKR